MGAKIDLRWYILLRTAFLAREEGTDSNKFRFGLAAAIDRRGYYLTAAHCAPTDKVSLTVVRKLVDSGSSAEAKQIVEDVEVVWRGDRSKGEPDLAILYGPRPPETVFDWAPEVKKGETVFAAGTNYGTPGVTSFEGTCIAGKLLGSVKGTSSSVPWLCVVSNAPLHPGDSGGPLVTLDGRLLAINYAYDPKLIGPNWGYATQPDFPWLNKFLDQDYAKRAGSPIVAFWAKPNPAEYLAELLIARLRELESSRIATGAPDDNRAAYLRQELVLKLLADEAGITGLEALTLQQALPRVAPNDPGTRDDLDRVLSLLRTRLQMK